MGSGKSTLLLAMMEELPPTQGQVSKSGRIAYIPQEAFLLNDTIRENIIFGRKFELEFYTQIIKECQLVHDLELLPGGDLT